MQPDKVIVNLSHKDVVLDYFMDKKMLVFELQSGFDLEVDGVHLFALVKGSKGVSSSFQRRLSKSSRRLLPRDIGRSMQRYDTSSHGKRMDVTKKWPLSFLICTFPAKMEIALGFRKTCGSV